MSCRKLETIAVLVSNSHWHKLILLQFDVQHLLSGNSACHLSLSVSLCPTILDWYWHLLLLWAKCVRVCPRNINREVVVNLCSRLNDLSCCWFDSNSRVISSSWSHSRWVLARLTMAMVTLLLSENVCEWNLAFAVLELFSRRCSIIDRGFINEACLLAWPFFHAWMLLPWHWGLWWPINRLLEGRSNSMKAETDCRLVPRGGASWLRVVQLTLLLCCLKHRKVCRVSSTLKCSNDRLLNGKLFHWVRRICGQSELGDLRRVSLLRIWVRIGRGFLWA